MRQLCAAVCLLLSGCSSHAPPIAADGSPPDIRVTATPRAANAGDPVVITCRVPRRAENRAVAWGIVGARTSAQELHGLESFITFTTTARRVPCGATAVFCSVGNDRGDIRTVTAPLVVACREGF